MSQVAVRRSKEREEGEICEVMSPGILSQNGDSEISERSFQAKAPQKKRRSRYDELEDKFNKKIDSVDSKLDRLFTLFSSKSRATSPDSHRDESSGDESHSAIDDVLSLHDKSDKIDLDTDSDSDGKISEATKKCLVDIFGDDAKVTSVKKHLAFLWTVHKRMCYQTVTEPVLHHF